MFIDAEGKDSIEHTTRRPRTTAEPNTNTHTHTQNKKKEEGRRERMVSTSVKCLSLSVALCLAFASGANCLSFGDGTFETSVMLFGDGRAGGQGGVFISADGDPETEFSVATLFGESGLMGTGRVDQEGEAEVYTDNTGVAVEGESTVVGFGGRGGYTVDLGSAFNAQATGEGASGSLSTGTQVNSADITSRGASASFDAIGFSGQSIGDGDFDFSTFIIPIAG